MSSKQTYQRVADMLAGEYALTTTSSKVTVENITASLADIFAQENELFDRKRFYLAALGRTTVREQPVKLTDWQFGGTVSHGTLNPDHLAPVFERTLNHLNPARARQLAIQYSTESDKQAYVVALMDALDLEAPEGSYFGAHPGDGSDFGFWENDDAD